ncbi:MAG: EAL domain-containing protein [Candidatus Methylumidiphilus sp.]
MSKPPLKQTNPPASGTADAGPGIQDIKTNPQTGEGVLPKHLQSHQTSRPWKVLLVDEEMDLVKVTRLLIKNHTFQQRPVECLEAYSADEARQLLADHPDIAVAFIDVAMETFDSGLNLVDYIRKNLGNTLMRIVMLTKETGRMPERYRVDHLDIDDYKEKGDLNEDRLYNTLRSTLKAYNDISFRYHEGVERRLSGLVADNAAEGIIICNTMNSIVSINPAFTRMTGFTEGETVGRNPKMMSSGLHDADYYHEMWESLRTVGAWHGEIWNRRKSGEVFPQWLSISSIKNESGEFLQFIGLFTDLSESKAAQERIYFLANYDELTKLPNRAMSRGRLERAINSAVVARDQLAVMLLDLDRFKVINESLGHSVGDALLSMVGQRLQGSVREHDTVGRQGGDEFLMIFPRAGIDFVARLAKRVLDNLSKPFDIDGHHLVISPSIGIAVYPNDGVDAETLLRNAEVAMYSAKNSGRCQYQFFTTELNSIAQFRLKLETGLRRALEDGEFVLHYQPQVETLSGRIVGCEALIRWVTPEGLYFPLQFIPLAEETGLIVPIGEWVLTTACSQVKAWQDSGLPAIPVAVNLSSVQFAQADIQQKIRSILISTGLAPKWLELEITETVSMSDADYTTETIHALNDLGISFAIDDFGTGYSSLSYLKRFRVSKLKIDKSFIHNVPHDPEDSAIVEAVINLGKILKLQTCAEGVETLEQFQYLKALHCDQCQGYFFGKPVPADDFARLLGGKT